MEVAIPQIHQAGDSFEPVSWQPSDIKDGMKPNFGRIRYQVSEWQLRADSTFCAKGFAAQQIDGLVTLQTELM